MLVDSCTCYIIDSHTHTHIYLDVYAYVCVQNTHTNHSLHSDLPLNQFAFSGFLRSRRDKAKLKKAKKKKDADNNSNKEEKSDM